MTCAPRVSSLGPLVAGTTAAAAAATIAIAPEDRQTGSFGVYVTNSGAEALWVEAYQDSATDPLTVTTLSFIVPEASATQLLLIPRGFGIAVASPAAGTTTYTMHEVIE